MERVCITCGDRFESPFTHIGWSNRPHETFFPDECHPCTMGRYMKYANRLFQAWRLSWMDDATASEMIGVDPGWFNDRLRLGCELFGPLGAGPFYDNQECGRAVAKFLSVARKRIAGGTPVNVVEFPARQVFGEVRP